MSSRTRERRTWAPSDTAFLLRLPLGLAIAWTSGEATWARVGAALARRRAGADDLRHRARLGAILAGRFTAAEIDRIHTASLAARTVRTLQFLRCHHPRGWQSECTIVGGEHLSRALALGRGAILWITPFAYASIATKVTLHRHGQPLTHLSRWEHGPSKTRWGVTWLNPVQRLAEDRFLRERVTIGEGRDPLAALRRLGICLAENRVVSITLGEEASSTVDVPFLAGTLKVPLGPIKLARRTGAPLLPTHTVAIGPGQFETTIEPALLIDGLTGASPAAAANLVATTLEQWATSRPEQLFWPGGLVVRDPACQSMPRDGGDDSAPAND